MANKYAVSINAGGFLKTFSSEEVVAKLAELGYGALDWPLSKDYNQPYPEFEDDSYREIYQKIGMIAKENKIKIFQTHAFFPTEDKDYQWLLTTMERQIEATSLLGAKYMVIHPMITYYKENKAEDVYRANSQFFRDLLPALKKYDVIGCLENMWSFDEFTHRIVRNNTSTVFQLLEYIEAINDPHLQLCLDFGHLQNIGCDIPTEIIRAGKHLAVIHAHDNDVYLDSHRLPLMGIAPWKEIIEALDKIHYQGTFNMEVMTYDRVGIIDKNLLWDMAIFAYKVASSLVKEE